MSAAREIIGAVGIVGMAITGPRLLVALLRAARALYALHVAKREAS